MPHIPSEAKEALTNSMPSTPGELNYAITDIICEYLEAIGLRYTSINTVLATLNAIEYITKSAWIGDNRDIHINMQAITDMQFFETILVLILEYTKAQSKTGSFDAIGAIKGAELEFYRLIVGPYENKAIKKNGNAYPEWLLKEVS